jgi:hypothetical protein
MVIWLTAPHMGHATAVAPFGTPTCAHGNADLTIHAVLGGQVNAHRSRAVVALHLPLWPQVAPAAAERVDGAQHEVHQRNGASREAEQNAHERLSLVRRSTESRSAESFS